MSDPGESLILGSGQQLSLLEADADGLPPAAYALNEAAGMFTGERIFSGNPKLYHAIAALLGRSIPYREISEICSVSVNTVCAVSLRERVPIETIRERVGRMALDVAFLSIEAARDMLADPVRRATLSPKDIILLFGIATQNGQLLLGGATGRIENVDGNVTPGHEDYLAFIKNVTRTGFGADNPAQKGALPQPIEVTASTPTEPSK